MHTAANDRNKVIVEPSETRISFLVKSLLVIGVVIVGCAVGVYALHGRITFFGDIDDKTFGIFGDFIGGFVGTIFNIIVTYLVWITYKSQKQELSDTKVLLLKQISISYKPDIFVKDNFINGHVNTSANEDPMDIQVSNAADEPGKQFANLPLVNIGVAAAKEFSYQWGYELEKCLTFLKANASDSIVFFEIENDGMWLKVFTNEDDANYFQVSGTLEQQRFDILLPYKDGADEKGIYLPLPYLIPFLIAVENDYIKLLKYGKQEPSYKRFPALKLKVDYKDLDNDLHRKEFEIKFEMLSCSTTRSATKHTRTFQLKVTGHEINL